MVNERVAHDDPRFQASGPERRPKHLDREVQAVLGYAGRGSKVGSRTWTFHTRFSSVTTCLVRPRASPWPTLSAFARKSGNDPAFFVFSSSVPWIARATRQQAGTV